MYTGLSVALPFSPLILGILACAALSPLLTFAALFQQKEWRLDRLREHLRRDGWYNQLFGSTRPPIIAIMFLIGLVPYALPVPYTTCMYVLLGILAVLSVIQVATKRQRMPRWTGKSILVVTLAALFSLLALAGTLQYPLVLPFILLLQPVYVWASWLVLRPLDSILKQRIMAKAAAHRAGLQNATVIGIAGSVGKTTTKELIAHLLQDLHPLVTPAHVNTEMGVAQWITGKKGNLFVIEMGAYAKGEIALLCRIAQPTIGIMTALGGDHVALFGSEEAIVEANGELIEALAENGHAFLYGDNDGCRVLAQRARCTVHLTGEKDLHATHSVSHESGISFQLSAIRYQLPLHGLHNVHNALLAIGVARHMGIADTRIQQLLATFTAPAHTFSVRTERGVLLLDDTYNISVLSLRAAIDWLGAQKDRPRTLCTSGLQEAGQEESRFLRELGAHARGKVERVIFRDPHGADSFAEGFGSSIETLTASTKRAEPGSVLACVGRMPLSTVQRMLPSLPSHSEF